MLIVRILISYIVGIVFATLNSIYIPVALLCAAGIVFVFQRIRELSYLLVIAAIANVTAMHDMNYNKAADDSDARSYAFEFVSDCIESLCLSDQAKSVAHGILLGDRQYLNNEQKREIREAGMSHVMAVSGLHVGIIYIVLFFLLKPLRWYGLHKLHRLLILLFMWGYVLMIGCPLSAVRASLMLSVFVLSWVLERVSDGIQVLCSAALIMLIYDTQQLWNVGFQLSCLATLGILLVQPVLEKQNRLMQLLTVTISAQIITLPIVAYYFHYIPLFGWLQGILVVPLLPLLIYALIVSLAFPMILVVTYPVEWIVDWMFFVAEKTSAIENFCLGGRILWYPSIGQTVLLETLILLSFLYFFSQRTQHAARRKYIFTS